MGHELFVNRVTELWFVGKELVRTKQLFGIDHVLAQEITGRNYDMVKGSTLRMKLEGKIDFKARYGRSPDLADAAFLCLDVARQRHGLVAVEPPEEGTKGQTHRQRRSIKNMATALSGVELEGI